MIAKAEWFKSLQKQLRLFLNKNGTLNDFCPKKISHKPSKNPPANDLETMRANVHRKRPSGDVIPSKPFLVANLVMMDIISLGCPSVGKGQPQKSKPHQKEFFHKMCVILDQGVFTGCTPFFFFREIFSAEGMNLKNPASVIFQEIIQVLFVRLGTLQRGEFLNIKINQPRRVFPQRSRDSFTMATIGMKFTQPL